MSAYQRRQELKRVNKCINDLQDDSSSISEMNRALDDIANDFYEGLQCEKTKSIIGAVERFEEPFQYSDHHISKAVEMLNNEARALQREIEAEEDAERAVREAKSMMGGR